MCVCVGPPDVIVKGSLTVLVNGLPAARITDLTAHGGVIVMGQPNVLIGDAGAAGGGGGGGGGAGGGGGGLLAALGDFVDAVVDVVVGREHYSDNIVIDGPPEFRAKTRAALDAIVQTPTGARLIAQLNDSGQTVTIVPNKPGKGNAMDPLDAGAMIDEDGKAGGGSGSTVYFDPDRTTAGPGGHPWLTRPPAIGLAHELTHAAHAAEGSIDITEVDNDHVPDPNQPGANAQTMQEEVRTAGIPPYDTDPINENKIRDEWDPPQPRRQWY